jgi:hypothetical protein
MIFDASKVIKMRTNVSAFLLTLSACVGALQYSQAALGQAQSKQLARGPMVASQNENEAPLLRGIENNSFENTPTQPNKTGDIKPEAGPGADSVMTPDLLLVNPSNKAGKTREPLQAFVGQSLTLKIERSDISLGNLQGIMVYIVNDTNRPLVLEGDSAQAVIDSGYYKCASLVTVQKSVLPINGGKAMAAGVFTKVLPAAATVGLDPTIKDVIQLKQPVRLRYGPDELRRLAEASRFGARILWPHEKTNGVVYFDPAVSLAGAKIEIPVETLFEPTDKTLLSGLLSTTASPVGGSP